MPGTIAAGQWFVLYMNEKPCILAGGPAGKTDEEALQQFRTMMLGSLPEDTKLEVKNIYDTPVDDVLRVAVIALMTSITSMSKTVDAMAGALAQRGLLRPH